MALESRKRHRLLRLQILLAPLNLNPHPANSIGRDGSCNKVNLTMRSAPFINSSQPVRE